MTQARIQRFGEGLGIKLPLDVATAADLTEGEELNVEASGNRIVLHRLTGAAKEVAQRAAEDMLLESRRYTLGVSIREILEQDRR